MADWSAAVRCVTLATIPAVIGCGGSANARTDEGAAALPVDVLQVNLVELRRDVEAVGTLAAHDEAIVSAEVEGRVARLAADMGDRVAKGASLVILDVEKLQYRAGEQRAALNQTRARLGAEGDSLPKPEQTPEVMSALARRSEAEQAVARARQLAARNLLPVQDLERAETQLQTAKAAYDTALALARNLLAEVNARGAALKGARRELQDTVIRAPFDGVVAERLVSTGQFVRVQTPVMRIVRLHPLRLTAQIPERFAPDVHVGQSMVVRVDAYPDRLVEGRVTRISPDVDQRSRAFAIEAAVPNLDSALKPGTFARVRIVTDRVEKTVAIPVTAVQTRYGRTVVFVVRDGTLSAADVKLGDRLGQQVEILDGLSAGMVIVADGVEGLTAGQSVAPRATPPKHGSGDGGR